MAAPSYDVVGPDRFTQHIAGSNLIGQDLTATNYVGADLRGANLDWCILTGADFTNSDLTNASLRHATLANCVFTGADLTGADLTGANLYGTTILEDFYGGPPSTPRSYVLHQAVIDSVPVNSEPFPTEPVAGYVMWFKADDLALANEAAVVALTDSSTNGNDAVQSDESKRGTYATGAKNGHASVVFNGTADWYETAEAVLVGTMFIVFNHTDGGATFTSFRRVVNGSTHWSWYGDSGNDAYAIESASIDTAEFFVNGDNTLSAGTLSDYRIVSALLPTPASNLVSIGDIVGVPDVQLFKGNMCEYLFYPTRLSASDRKKVESYLSHKYAITVTS